jgi:KDO2-lipid IV(A) lauroyltransferase
MLYFIAIPFIYLVALLPFRVMYLLSDLLFFFLYRVAGYRRNVVRQNLILSFPEKSSDEIAAIEKKFYVFLCDLMLETFKTLTISKEEALRRCTFKDHSIFDRLAAEKRNVIVVMGHYGNWEWASNTMTLICNYQLYVIYRPLADKKFDALMMKMRTRFGARLYAFSTSLRGMLANRNTLNATAFLADQTPLRSSAYWMQFLNQDTAVFTGTEKIARKLNYPVVYARVDRPRRGYYEISLELICEHPAATKEGEITEMHTRKLEKDIREKPEIWIWSHRRWKHHRNNPLQPDQPEFFTG